MTIAGISLCPKAMNASSPSLSADEVVPRLGPVPADRDRLLETEMSYTGDQLMEYPSVAGSRIEHGDRVDRDHLDFGSGCHSTNLRRVRPQI